MKLTLAEPKYLRDSIMVISDLVNEARFKITPEAMELVAMDPANVAMVIFKLLGSAFAEYNVKKDIEIGINLNNFKQILRRVKPTDVISIGLSPDNRLEITLTGKNVRTFSLPIIELEEKEQKIPDLSFPVIITAPSSELNDAIEDAGVVADSVAFIAEQGKFIIEAKGDLNKARIEMKKGEDVKIKMDKSERLKAKYSVEYLKKMINGSKLSDNVVIKFNNDYPLQLEYKDVNKVMLSFILAPRVETE